MLLNKVMSIQILPLSVSTYISAGEVICNSASVVKELVENSIDAGATRIDIEIKEGGLQSIIVRDNGCGISKSDLKISLLRHSTSKICSIRDLDNISTLGFRGEALASISAVSHIILSSCDKSSDKLGWSIYSDGFGVVSGPNLIAHTRGTTFSVLNLFFNRSVRRKIVKSEYLEFLKIDEIVRCLSLSVNGLSISLKHNNKLIRYYNNFSKDLHNRSIVNSIYGISCIQELIHVNYSFENMKITGWLYLLKFNNSSAKKAQYFYVNRRIVFNKFMRHAVYQSVYEIGKNKYDVSFILYLELDSSEIDVNVHPEKKVIKLVYTRLVHSFIYKAIRNSLKNYFILNNITKFISKISKIKQKNNLNIKCNILNKNKQKFGTQCFDAYNDSINVINDQELNSKPFKCEQYFNTIFGNVLILVKRNYLLIEKNEKLFLLSLPKAKLILYKFKLFLGVEKGLRIENLNKKFVFILQNSKERCFFVNYKKILSHIGINFCIVLDTVNFHSIPFILVNQNLNLIFSKILYFYNKQNAITLFELIDIIINNFNILIKYWNHLQVLSIISEFEQYSQEAMISSAVSEILKPINLSPTLDCFKYGN